MKKDNIQDKTSLFFRTDPPFDAAYRNGNTLTPVGPHLHDAIEFYYTLSPLPDVLIDNKVIVVPADSAWQNLAQVLAAAQQQEPVPFASCGNGTPQHLAGEMLAQARQVPLQQVPYKGCGPAQAAVAGSQVPMAIITASSAAPLVQSGKLRALAVTSPQRSPLLPGVATVAEQGVPDFAVDQWHGLQAPVATPAATVQQLNRALREVLRKPEVAQAIAAQGFAMDGGSAEDFQRMVLSDIERYAQVTQAIGLKID